MRSGGSPPRGFFGLGQSDLAGRMPGRIPANSVLSYLNCGDFENSIMSNDGYIAECKSRIDQVSQFSRPHVFAVCIISETRF